MTYNLVFIKISNNHRFAGVGFGGNIFIVLNSLTRIDNNDELHVDMETNECACTEKSEFLHDTKNCWEYYFEQPPLSEGLNVNLDSVSTGSLSYNSDLFMSPDNFKGVKQKFHNNFKLKQYLEDAINEFYNNNIENKTTLGVQIRLTDMKQYHKVSSLSDYINKINNILSTEPGIEQIFLATDDSTIIPKLQESVAVPIVYHEGMYRADEDNPLLHPYDRFDVDKKLHRYNLGVECVKEIFTLTKCDYLLKAHTSAISMVACMLSENIKNVYRL